MSTATLPASNKSWLDRLPVISHLRMSSGLQRGMLIAGLILSGLFIITALFAPLIAPFDFAQSSDASGDFPRQAAPDSKFVWGTTATGYDVFSRTLFGAQTAIWVILAAVVMSLFLGVLLGLILGFVGAEVGSSVIQSRMPEMEALSHVTDPLPRALREPPRAVGEAVFSLLRDVREIYRAETAGCTALS